MNIVSRRQFFRRASRWALATAPVSLAFVGAPSAWAQAATGFTEATNDTANKVLDEAALGELRSWRTRTRITPRSEHADSFHQQFDAPVAFTQPLRQLPLRQGLNGSFGIAQGPFLAVNGRYYAYSELNLPELVELNNAQNANLYCGCPSNLIRRAPVPNAFRQELTSYDRGRFAHEMEGLGINPRYVTAAYKRSFCDCSTGKPMVGYGFEVDCECIPWAQENAYTLRARGVTVAKDGVGFRVMAAS